MAIYDMLMIVIMIGAILLGAWRGMAWQLAPIASLVCGGVAAHQFADKLAPWFGEKGPANYLFALLSIYVAVSLSIYMVARSVRNAIEKFKMEAYDRHLGAMLGGVKGLLLCLVVTFFLVTMSPPAREHIRTSHSGYFAAVLMDRMHDVMPPAVLEAIEPYIHSLDDAVEDGPHDHGHSLRAHRDEEKPEQILLPKTSQQATEEAENLERRLFRFAEDKLEKALQR